MENIIPIFIGITCLIILTILFLTIRFIIQKYRNLCNVLFHTDNLIEGITKRNKEIENTPKSISAMTRIYLPQISKDFPEFHYTEMRERAESLLRSYFLALDKNNISLLTEGSIELKNQLSTHLSSNSSQAIHEHIRNPKIHRTELYKYSKFKGKVVITFQSAIQYYHYFTDSNEMVTEGYKDIYQQTLYNISVFYIQDSSLVEESKEQGVGLNCPNCGAPIHSLGAKYCPYCDTEVIEVNRFVWSFGEIVEDSKYA